MNKLTSGIKSDLIITTFGNVSMKKEEGDMKISRLILFLSLLFISLFLYECKADWKKDLTELGFYAILDGEAYLLKFKNLGKGNTRRRLLSTEFGEIPTIKKNDFILLYGDMPEGPLETTVEMLRYEISQADNTYIFGKSLGEIDNSFKVIPMGSFRGRKLIQLIPVDEIVDGVYFFHKNVGLNSDAYLGFKIEGFIKLETGDKTPLREQVDAFSRVREKTTRTNLTSLERAIDFFIAQNDRTPNDLREVQTFSRSVYVESDAWGNPIKYERISDSKYRLISAGKDKTFNTEDDIIIKN